MADKLALRKMNIEQLVGDKPFDTSPKPTDSKVDDFKYIINLGDNYILKIGIQYIEDSLREITKSKDKIYYIRITNNNKINSRNNNDYGNKLKKLSLEEFQNAIPNKSKFPLAINHIASICKNNDLIYNGVSIIYNDDKLTKFIDSKYSTELIKLVLDNQ